MILLLGMFTGRFDGIKVDYSAPHRSPGLGDQSMLKSVFRGIVVTALAVVPLVGIGVTASAATSVAKPHTATSMSKPSGPHAISSFCAFTSSQPTLSEGAMGAAVKQLQCELNWGFAFGSSDNFGNGPFGGVTVDGDFGPNTFAATRAFQREVGISIDGVVGPVTWSHLNSCVNSSGFC
jgi:lysozyme